MLHLLGLRRPGGPGEIPAAGLDRASAALMSDSLDPESVRYTLDRLSAPAVALSPEVVPGERRRGPDPGRVQLSRYLPETQTFLTVELDGRRRPVPAFPLAFLDGCRRRPMVSFVKHGPPCHKSRSGVTGFEREVVTIPCRSQGNCDSLEFQRYPTRTARIFGRGRRGSGLDQVKIRIGFSDCSRASCRSCGLPLRNGLVSVLAAGRPRPGRRHRSRLRSGRDFPQVSAIPGGLRFVGNALLARNPPTKAGGHFQGLPASPLVSKSPLSFVWPLPTPTRD